jgi:hypothetical protein
MHQARSASSSAGKAQSTSHTFDFVQHVLPENNVFLPDRMMFVSCHPVMEADHGSESRQNK